MDLNLITCIYLLIRLSSFIVACYYTFSPFYQKSFKGLVYLVGLIVSLIFTISFSFLGIPYLEKQGVFEPVFGKSEKCNLLYAGLSKIPLSSTIFGYTFGYLVYNMGINNNAKYYITTLIIFCILILTDWAFNILNNCYNVAYTFISFFLGGGIGILASYIVINNYSDMQYYSISPTICSYNYNNVYQCVDNSHSRQPIQKKKNETDEEKKKREDSEQSVKKEQEEEENRKKKFEKTQLDLFIVMVIWFIIFSLVAYIVSIKK